MVVVEKAPDWESRALPGYQPYPSPTCTMILGNAIPFLCLGFHVCTVRMLIGKRKHSFGQRGARNARYVPGSVLGAGDTVVNTGPAQSLLAGRQNRRASQGQDCPEMFKPLLEIHGHAWVLLGQQEQRGTCYVAAASLPPKCISWPAYSLASTPAPCVRGHLIAPHPRPLTFYFQGQDLAGYILAHHALS